MPEYDFYKDDESQIYIIETPDEIGAFLFSFDKKKIYDFYKDFPQKLTPEEIEIFKREFPYMASLKLK